MKFVLSTLVLLAAATPSLAFVRPSQSVQVSSDMNYSEVIPYLEKKKKKRLRYYRISAQRNISIYTWCRFGF